MSAEGLHFKDLLEFQFEPKTSKKLVFSCSFQVMMCSFCARSRCSATTHGNTGPTWGDRWATQPATQRATQAREGHASCAGEPGQFGTLPHILVFRGLELS